MPVLFASITGKPHFQIIAMNLSKTVQDTIDAAAPQAQTRLNEMLAYLRQAAPGACESLKWGQLAILYSSIHYQYAVFTNLISLYPTPSAVAAFNVELSPYKTSSSTIQFPLYRPLSPDWFGRIEAHCARESENGSSGYDRIRPLVIELRLPGNSGQGLAQ